MFQRFRQEVEDALSEALSEELKFRGGIGTCGTS
jgi:hypothetical protein